MAHNIEKAIVRLWRSSREISGAGFLVGSNYIITCAHVVLDAINNKTSDQPKGNILLDFPLVSPNRILRAQVVDWRPDRDAALLKLIDELPAGVQTMPIERVRDISDHKFQVYGFPEGRDYGIWSFGRILRQNAKGFFQIESDTYYSVQPGFSGSLVWDATLKTVVGIIIETDRDVKQTHTAYFIHINNLIDTFTNLAISQTKTKDNGFKYACFISYPNEAGIQGQLVREFAEAIRDALEIEIGALLDKPIYFDREHLVASDKLAEALCESICMVMIFTPKYFNRNSTLCASEFRAMEELESRRFSLLGYHHSPISFIIPVRPYSQDVLPMRALGHRRDYDFRNMTITGNLRGHPHYGPKIRDIAEHIFRCYQLMTGCDDDPCKECVEFKLPEFDQINDLLQFTSEYKFAAFPGR